MFIVMDSRYHHPHDSLSTSSTPHWSDKINSTAFAGSALTFTSPLGTFPCPATPDSNFSPYSLSPLSNQNSPGNRLTVQSPIHFNEPHMTSGPIIPTPSQFAGYFQPYFLPYPEPPQNIVESSNFGHLYQTFPPVSAHMPVMMEAEQHHRRRDDEEQVHSSTSSSNQRKNPRRDRMNAGSSHAAYARLNRERRKKYIADLEYYRGVMRKKKVQDHSTLNKLREESAQLKDEIGDLRKQLMNNRPLMALLTGIPKNNARVFSDGKAG